MIGSLQIRSSSLLLLLKPLLKQIKKNLYNNVTSSSNVEQVYENMFLA